MERALHWMKINNTGFQALGRFKAFFARRADAEPDETSAQARPAVEMTWLADKSRPIPDWEAIAGQERPEWGDQEKDVFWTSAAAAWLTRLAEDLGQEYRVSESSEFVLMSALPDRPAKVFLTSCETSRKRILRFLEGIASDRVGWGKHVVIVLEDQDDYYDYISNFHGEGGEYAMSSGVFIHAGYGHFVVWSGDMRVAESVIAHELTHCLVSHLPIPAWLNEGMAVNIERRIFPYLAHPDMQEHAPAEMQAKHEAFWSEETIQDFWSGELFLRAGEGNMLAYDLATKITSLAAKDYDAFREFACQADCGDGGLSGQELLGYPLAHLVEAVLGPGTWAPTPGCWNARAA
jgi:hypothetical protein